MALVNMRSLLKDAQSGGWAVGSFSVANMECVRGVVNAAEELRAPIILQIAEVRLPHSPLALMGPLMLAAAKRATVPVAVHLDHGKTIPCIQEALSLGFTSVMCDGSELPIEENIKLTEEVVSLASKYDAAVEAEVGRVGRGEDGSEAEAQIASLDDCFRMDKTGIDALAVGIGNAHGLYAAAPHLRYDVLEKLNGNLRAALVLHGGSGIENDYITRGIKAGIAKINVGTELRQPYERAMRERNDVPYAQEKVYTRCRELIRDFLHTAGDAGVLA